MTQINLRPVKFIQSYMSDGWDWMVIKGHGYSKSTFGANNIFGVFGGNPPSSFTGKISQTVFKTLTAPKVFAKKQLPKKDNPSTSDKVKCRWLN